MALSSTKGYKLRPMLWVAFVTFGLVAKERVMKPISGEELKTIKVPNWICSLLVANSNLYCLAYRSF